MDRGLQPAKLGGHQKPNTNFQWGNQLVRDVDPMDLLEVCLVYLMMLEHMWGLHNFLV